jgi:hypothetical protein
VIDSTYRSRSGSHKVIVDNQHESTRESLLAQGGSLVATYESFSLIKVPGSLDSARAEALQFGGAVRDDLNVLLLRTGAVDTSEISPAELEELKTQQVYGDRLYLIQMVGPVKQEWYDALAAHSEILCYVPNNAFLVRATDADVALVALLKTESNAVVQWAGGFNPAYKISPDLNLAAAGRDMWVTVQIADSDHIDFDLQQLASLSSSNSLVKTGKIENFVDVRIRIAAHRIPEVSQMDNVVWIEPWRIPTLLDERQGLIVASKFAGAQVEQSSYLAWLQSKGLAITPDFVVDIADTGFDQGDLDPEVMHKDFLNPAGVARVVYARMVSGSSLDGIPNDTGGHGTLNAAIVGGYNTFKDFPYADFAGYNLGLGVHPFAKLGITKIFGPDFTDPDLRVMVDAMYADGTRISSNSWGSDTNAYGVDSQIYDSLVRDSQGNEPGNQEMTFVFAAGNQGPGGKLSSPATAKNVIAVGAGENLRDGVDGCGIGPDGGDDAMSIISFSSGGPTTDGRVKPDLVAPGTHIQGARSQDPAYDGRSVCGPANFPAGQTLYTWSSGTSHSTPAVAGAAALVRQWFQQGTGHAPSPAMVKAYLTNSTSYMTGNLASGDLPGNNQGWGLVNIGRAFDDTPRVTLDQNQVFSSTGQSFTLEGTIVDTSKPFRVTIAWTDAPGTVVANPAVNDLDLQVEIDGKTYLGNRFSGQTSVEGGTADHLNNVESVWLPAGTNGDFVVRVVAANIVGDGVPANTDPTDQDFALVIYNAQSGQGDGSIDSPPVVNLVSPVGGERLVAGHIVRILWDASDDKGILSQKVEFSSDAGATFTLLASLDGNARSLDWHVPDLPTHFGRVRITALDGVNLPISSASRDNFELVTGPPDMSPPSVQLLSPTGDSLVGGGTTTQIKWTEDDDVGVTRRVLELSLDAGNTFQTLASVTGPGSGEQQSYGWEVPASPTSTKCKVRITVFDGAGNSATATSLARFEIWALPIIKSIDLVTNKKGKGELQISGRDFRLGETEVYADGTKLSKVKFTEKCDSDTGICRRLSSLDKKLNKKVPEGQFTKFVVVLPRTGQASPVFSWKRKKPKATG